MAGLIALILAAVAIGLVQWRVSLWRMEKMFDEKGRPLDDPALNEMVRRLGACVDLPELKAEVLDMPVVNGLATPDGRIFVTSALVDKHRFGIIRAEEIASVVAHELGHVALGHHTRRMIDWSGQNAARMALGLILNRFLPIIGFYIANFLAGLFMARLSRRDEFEADRYATALMLKAGLGHAPQVSMFRKLDRMMPGPKPAAWMASHPPTEERVAAIEANVAAWEATAAQG
ncbi:M48 family metallopeptidase [Rubrimonas cliftonensis]|uniref:Putative metalloprotease n=1 Tax=Rubrimonas cliftonensis TaxID=89524 RepID=A0A1H3Z3G5_9RHOB|nr:M48 family metallopeptidase [Rubrimonas cliftonensis]SEA17862.1 putative metalloprotease [Rubrimonas cliftonensis]